MRQNDVSCDRLLEIIGIQTEVVQLGMDLGGIIDFVTRRAQQITNADGASVELIQKSELVYSAASGMAERFLGLRLGKEASLSGQCVDAGEPLISNDIELDDRVNKGACRLIGLNSMIVVPLIHGEDAVGVLKVLSAKADHFDEESIAVLEMISKLVAAAMFSAMQNSESELFHRATHDSLTGIPNRSLFYDRLRQKLSQAMRNDGRFGILSVDLDGLKEINDDHGHRAGDAAIREVAMRSARVLREADTIARLGGDEFGIIADGAVSQQDLTVLAERIDGEISKSFVFEGREIPLRASVGHALYGEDGVVLEALLDKADQSMYAVKRAHKGPGNVR